MATNNHSTGRTEPSKADLLLMLSEAVALLEQYKAENQQLEAENQQLKTEWEQAFLRLEQNVYTIRTLSEQKERRENENDKLITKNIILEAQQRRCPHKHQ